MGVPAGDRIDRKSPVPFNQTARRIPRMRGSGRAVCFRVWFGESDGSGFPAASLRRYLRVFTSGSVPMSGASFLAISSAFASSSGSGLTATFR